VFEYQGLQYIRDKYSGLFGQHARTMVQFMRQADMHGVAKFVTHWVGVYGSADPARGVQLRGFRHLISPRWLEEM